MRIEKQRRTVRKRRTRSLRFDEDVAKWFVATGRRIGCSANAAMEAWLSVLPEVMRELEAEGERNPNVDPEHIVEGVGWLIVHRLARMKLGGDLLECAVQFVVQERRERFEALKKEIAEDRAERAARIKGERE